MNESRVRCGEVRCGGWEAGDDDDDRETEIPHVLKRPRLARGHHQHAAARAAANGEGGKRKKQKQKRPRAAHKLGFVSGCSVSAAAEGGKKGRRQGVTERDDAAT